MMPTCGSRLSEPKLTRPTVTLPVCCGAFAPTIAGAEAVEAVAAGAGEVGAVGLQAARRTTALLNAPSFNRWRRVSPNGCVSMFLSYHSSYLISCDVKEESGSRVLLRPVKHLTQTATEYPLFFDLRE